MANQPKIDPCGYVRDTYNVPARIGMHVEIGGRKGVIKGGSNYIKVLMQGDKQPCNYHPTDGVSYFNDDGSLACKASVV